MYSKLTNQPIIYSLIIQYKRLRNINTSSDGDLPLGQNESLLGTSRYRQHVSHFVSQKPAWLFPLVFSQWAELTEIAACSGFTCGFQVFLHNGKNVQKYLSANRKSCLFWFFDSQSNQ